MITKFHLVDFINSAIKWKKPIITLCILAIVGSVTLNFLMKPVYESTTTIFPANPSLTDKSQLFDSGQGNMAVDMYGDKEDVDRLIQIAKSGQVLGHIIKEHNLMTWYKIDTTLEEGKWDAAIGKLKKNISIEKTEYRGIQITVKDKDKNKAAKMANDIVAKTDELAQNMIKDSRKELKEIFDNALIERQQNLQNITDSLIKTKKEYGQYLLLNIEEKAEELTSDITQTKVSLSELQAQYAVLKKKYSNSDLRIISLQSQITGLEKRLETLKKEWDQNLENQRIFEQADQKIKILELNQEFAVDELKTHQKTHDYYSLSANQSVSFIYVMERANPADKEKSVLMLILSASLIVTLVLSVVTATVLDKLNAATGK